MANEQKTKPTSVVYMQQVKNPATVCGGTNGGITAQAVPGISVICPSLAKLPNPGIFQKRKGCVAEVSRTWKAIFYRASSRI